ncbi:hypothetical protein V1477_005673 [Vespula maculifrons]|uniref:Uncharacterized protein n=1 Tax=Vespula maculifrons TaxID=7453 RepID=A0ABD2CLS2_VESMC
MENIFFYKCVASIFQHRTKWSRKEKKRGRRKVQADRVGRQGRPASSRQAGRQASKQANTSKQARKEGR